MNRLYKMKKETVLLIEYLVNLQIIQNLLKTQIDKNTLNPKVFQLKELVDSIYREVCDILDPQEDKNGENKN